MYLITPFDFVFRYFHIVWRSWFMVLLITSVSFCFQVHSHCVRILNHGAFNHACWFCYQVLSHCVRILIHGAFNHSCLFPGTFTLCKDPDSWCIRSRLLSTSRPATVYDCDNRHQCQYFNMTSGSSLVCRNVGIGKHLHCIVCLCLCLFVFSFVSLFFVDSSSEEKCQSTNNLKQG